MAAETFFFGLEAICEWKCTDFQYAWRHGHEKDESPLRGGIIQTALASVSSSHWARGTAKLLSEGTGACTAIWQLYARQRKFEAVPACLVATATSLTSGYASSLQAPKKYPNDWGHCLALESSARKVIFVRDCRHLRSRLPRGCVVV